MCQFCGVASHGLSRRALFGGGLAALALAGSAMSRSAWAASDAAVPGIPGDEALRRIMAGNARYVGNHPTQRDFSTGRAERLTTQRPIAAVLSCANSRVAPEFAFDEGPGQLFVIRVAGNILDDDGAASLEYAVRFLGVRLAMVLGHRNCGAVDAAIKVVKDGATLPGHLPGLIDAIKPAVLAAAATKPTDLAAAATVETCGRPCTASRHRRRFCRRQRRRGS